MDWKKLQNIIDTFNSYYSIALLLYAFVLYSAAHYHIFLFAAIALTPVLTGWGGYLLHGYFQRRNQHYGFRTVSEAMSLEINPGKMYTLRYTTTLKAVLNHLFLYPVGYQWSGSGDSDVPKLADPGQRILGVVDKNDGRKLANVSPFKESVLGKGDWRYWVVGLARPAFKGDEVIIQYVQEFNDKKHIAKPCLYYVVNSSIKKLTLNVKFAEGLQPKAISADIIKPADARHNYPVKNLRVDEENNWARWEVANPKVGYCYRIQWK